MLNFTSPGWIQSDTITNFSIMISVILITIFFTGCSSSNIKNTPLNGQVDLQGHRGARGARPENTLPAFKYCIEQNMTTIELDTNVTKDKELIIHHDSELNGDICIDETGENAQKIAIET